MNVVLIKTMPMHSAIRHHASYASALRKHLSPGCTAPAVQSRTSLSPDLNPSLQRSKGSEVLLLWHALTIFLINYFWYSTFAALFLLPDSLLDNVHCNLSFIQYKPFKKFYIAVLKNK